MKNLNYHKPTSLNLTNERKQNLKGNFINTLLFAGKKFHFAIIIFFAILANILTPIKVLAYLTNIPVGTTQTVTTNWSPGTAIVVYGVLIINPGVTIEMPPNSFITVEENGRLVAIGTSGSPITFTNVPTYNHWAGMQILGNPAIPLQPSYSDAYSGHVTIYGGSYTHDYKGAAFLKYCNI